MGNVAISVVKRNVAGAQRNVIADVTFSNSYATNGDTIVANDIAKLLPGASGLGDVLFFEYFNPVAGQFTVLDKTNKKFLLFSVAGVQATNATDQSSVVIRVRLHYGGVSG